MPANLTPQYHAAEEAYRRASTVEEKIAALEEMLAVIPKHKGTEKLQADIKRRLSRLRQEGQKKSATARHNPFYVEKQGAGQVVLAGYPNCGKSALTAALTRARTKVADYPFTTTVPLAGMVPYRDIFIQLVDTPPVTPEQVPPGLPGLYRNADALLIMIDASSGDCLEQMEGLLNLLKEKKILASTQREGPTPSKRCLLVASKADLPVARDNIPLLAELKPPELELIPVSTVTGENLDVLPERLFQLLDIIRVYSKVPGKEPDLKAPFVLKRGSTVLDLAAAIHKDLAQRFKQARIWGSARFEGQSVPRDYELCDGDIVEIHHR